MNESNKVIKGLKSQSSVVIILGVIDLTYFSLMSRLLTKEEFGLYAIITAISTILTEISSAGLGAAIVQKKEPNKDYIATAYTLSIIMSIINFSILLLASDLLSGILVNSKVLTVPLILMSLAMSISIVNGIGRAFYIRKLDFFLYGIIQIICVSIGNIIGIVMAYYNMGIYAIVSAVLMNNLFMTIYLYGIRKLYTPLLINKTVVKEIFSYGGWLTASGIVRSIYEQIDKLITSRWLPISQLGAYNRPAGFLTSISSQVNGIFDTILFPILSKIQDDNVKITKAYIKITETIWIVAIIFVILLLLSSNIVISIFLGTKWLELSPVYYIISVSVIFMFYGRIGDSFFRSLGIVKEYFEVRVLVCGISIVLIALGCQFGIFGLAIAVLLSRLADSIIKIITLRKKNKL